MTCQCVICNQMICYCVSCAEKILNLGEPHACRIEFYGCHALINYIGEPHNCPVDELEEEDDEGFEDQSDLTYEKLREIAIRIRAGENVVLIRFKDGH